MAGFVSLQQLLQKRPSLHALFLILAGDFAQLGSFAGMLSWVLRYEQATLGDDH